MSRISVPWKTYFYYKRLLDPTERKIYDKMLEGLLEWRNIIVIPSSRDFQRIYQIYLMVLKDCPMLFHVSNRLSATMGSIFSSLEPEYTMNETTYQQKFAQVQAFLLNCRKMIQGRNSFDKVRILHDAIRRHVIYHNTSTVNEHNVLGTILDRKAVCESVAKAYKLMCDINAIPAIVVFGRSEADNGYVRPAGFSVSQTDQEDNHAWNKVRVDNVWYNVDVTYDLCSETRRNGEHLPFDYDYFLRSDSLFHQDHSPSKSSQVPLCPQDFQFYRKVGKHASSGADVTRLALEALRSTPRELVIELDPSFRISLEDLTQQILDTTHSFPVTQYSYSYNDKLRVLRMNFQ